MPQNTYQSLNVTADVVLSWPFSFLNQPVLLDINDINPSSTGPWNITLPDATLVNNGMSVVFNNLTSLYSYTILAFDNTTVITTITAATSITLYLQDNSTSNGIWGINTVSGVTTGITNLVASSTDSSITITNGNITPPGGTIDFQLPTSINNLTTINTQGFLVVDGLVPNTYTTTVLAGGANIIVTNVNGLNGTSTISLNSSVSGLTSLQIGTINITGNEINTVNDTDNLVINSGVNGDLYLNGVIIDPDGNISAINNLTISGKINSPNSALAYGTIIDSGFTVNVYNSYNVSSMTGTPGSGIYTVFFANILPSEDYPVALGVNIGSSSSPTLYSAYVTVTHDTGVAIKVYDSGGVLTAPTSGISFVAFSPN